SFYRIIGTFIGGSVALLFVGLFAQERVLFLGALSLWVGLCSFGSQYVRNFAAYSFVLSGYTTAIVGIPGALDAGHAFYVATARVTEISLGIIVTATISHLIPAELTRCLPLASDRRCSRGACGLCPGSARQWRFGTGAREAHWQGGCDREHARVGVFRRPRRAQPKQLPSPPQCRVDRRARCRATARRAAQNSRANGRAN